MTIESGNGHGPGELTRETTPDAPVRAASPMRDEVFRIGQTVRGCVIEARIAEGGQGVVYRAHQLNPDRTVAIKTLRPGAALSRRVKRFMGECENLARSPHPNIVALHEVGTAQDAAGNEVPFLIMEYIPEAQSLTAAARRHHWDQRRRIEKFLDASRAVERLHKHGVRHFDLKPGNILVDDSQWVRVSDFGLARSHAERIEAGTGGTLTHMSPEQCRGDAEALDARSDVYSMGVVLYELLSGERPIDLSRFERGSMRLDEAYDLICNEPPTPLGSVAPDVDPALEAIVMRALEKSPSRRYEDMRDFRRALEGWLEEHGARWTLEGLMRRALLPVALSAVLIAGSAFVAAKWIGPWAARRSGFIAWYEVVLASSIEPVTPGSDLLHSAVIAFGEETDAPALAAARGVDGVTDAVISHRALHGELCKALVRSGARAVVFDIIFRRESEYDGALAAGFEALRDAGIPVVMAAPSWAVDESTGRPELSEPLWRLAGWGCYEVQMGPDDDSLWIPLGVRSESGEVTPSLSLEAFAASRDASAYHEFEMPPDHVGIDVVRWHERGAERDRRRTTGVRESVPLTSFTKYEPDPRMKAYGKRETDTVALYRPVLFDLGPLERVTHAYEDVLGADEVELRTWFADRTIFVGNFTARGRDLHPFRGEQWGGVYFHVLSFESLSRGVHPRAGGLPMHFWIGVPAAVVALLATARGRGRKLWARVAVGLLVVAAIGVLSVATGMIAYREMRVLMNPVTPVVAGLIVCVVAAAWCAVRPRGIPRFVYGASG